MGSAMDLFHGTWGLAGSFKVWGAVWDSRVRYALLEPGDRRLRLSASPLSSGDSEPVEFRAAIVRGGAIASHGIGRGIRSLWLRSERGMVMVVRDPVLCGLGEQGPSEP